MHQATVVPKSPAGREGWVTTSSGLTTTAPPGANVPAGWKTARESKQLVPRKPSRRKQTKGGADGVLRPLSLILCLLVFALALPVVSPVWLSDANRFLVPSIQSAARSVGVTSSHVKSPALFPSGDAVSPALTTLCIVAAGHMVASWSQFEARLTQAALVLLLGTASIVVAAWIHSQAELPTQIATSVAMAGGCVMTGSLLYTEVTATMLVMYELVALPIGDDPDEADAELLSRPWQSIKAWGSFLCPACLVAVNLLQIALTPLDQGSSWTLVLKIVAFVAYLATFMLHAFVTDVAAIVRIARQRQSAGSACSSCLSLASCRRPGVFKETTLGSRAARVLIVAMALAVQWAAPTFTVFMAPTSACESAWVSANGSAWPTGLEHTAAGRATIQASADLNLQLHWSVAYSTVASVVLYLVASQSFISSRRARDASAAASRLRGALRYISHEARSPLGGAILSLTLMDDAIDDGDTPASKALVGDLHVSLEAAKRHLDDLLLFEKVTGSGEDSGAWGWDGFGRSTLSRQTRAFRGACRAEGIDLSITSASGRLNVGATLEGWRQELDAEGRTWQVTDDRDVLGAAPAPPGLGQTSRFTMSALGSPSHVGPKVAVGNTSSHSARRAGSSAPSDKEPTGSALPWEVFMNWQRIDAVVQNAVSNSIKHAPGDGEGRVAVSFAIEHPTRMSHIGLPLSSLPSDGGQEPEVPTRAKSRSRNPRGARGLAASRKVFPGGAALPGRPATKQPGRPADAAVRRVLVIEVLDNGRGIPADMLLPGKLFRPFQQLRMGDSALRMTSSGLGLSIVKSVVVDQMGGEVGLASREGEGTLFFAHIPVWARRSASLHALPTAPGGRWTIMSPELFRSSAGLSSGGDEAKAPAPASANGASAPAGSWGEVDRTAHRRRRSSCGSAYSQSCPEVRAAARAASQGRERAQPEPNPAWRGPVRGNASPSSAGDSSSSASPSFRSREERAARRARRAKERAEASVTSSGPSIPSTPFGVGSVAARSAASGPLCQASLSGSHQGLLVPPPLPAMEIRPACDPMTTAFVVDDERVNRTLMARVIRRWGVEVTEMDDGTALVGAMQSLADSGAEAPAWPTFVTLDIEMPGLDGCAALAELRKLADRLEASGRELAAAGLRAVVVVGVTGNAHADDRKRMLSLGARRVLTKPVEPRLVAETVVEHAPDTVLPERAFKRLKR